MNLYEYQGQKILKKFGIKSTFSLVGSSTEESLIAYKKISENIGNNYLVIKAQIIAGGRGQGGGIKLAKSIKEVFKKSYKIIGMYLRTPQTSEKGKVVKKIIISQNIYLKTKKIKEYYISLVLNRSNEKNRIIYSTAGGEDLEKVVYTNKIFIEEIHTLLGLQLFQIRNIAFNLKLNSIFLNEFIYFLSNITQAYFSYDASLLEINPVLKTYNNKIISVDVKLILDNNALYRQYHYIKCKNQEEKNTINLEKFKLGLNYLKLEGNMGCIVNGAGLALATMDLINHYGGCTANFLDIRGTADANLMKNACNIIIKKNIFAILINIFGGIVRCDQIVKGIISAYTRIKNYFIKPLILRLEGTNYEKSKLMIEKSKLNVYSVISLKEAAKIIKKLIPGY